MKNPTGELRLTFRKKQNGTTYVPGVYYTGPMKVVSPFYEDADGTAFLYLLNLSGGIVGGDRLLTDVQVEQTAQVLLTTPSANKLYKMKGTHAEIENCFRVGERAALEYVPECSIPFALSKTFQSTTVYLEQSSYLFAVDFVTPGRMDRGEYFSYERYSSNVKIYINGILEAYEKTNLLPRETDVSQIGLMEACSHYASVYIYHQAADRMFTAKLNGKIAKYEDVKGGASLIGEALIVIKLLGSRADHVQAVIDEIWGASRQHFLHKPAVGLRKG